MLQRIRDRLEGTIAKIIIALIAVPFALWGIESFFTGGSPDVAEVNGVAISQVELGQAIELRRRQLQSQEKVDAASLEESRLRGPVLDELIDRLLLRQVAERSGFHVSDAQVNAQITSDEDFKENGQFSQARFQNIVASNGMSPLYFRNMLREQMLIYHVVSGLAASDFVTNAEIADVARITQQSVDVRYLTVPAASADTPVEVPAERVQAYYAENKDEFRTEESVRVDYLELRLEDLYQPVDEKLLREEFDRRVKDFVAGQERHAAHIMLTSLDDDKAQSKLAEIRARAVAGEDFAALARESSEDAGSAESGGDLGYSSGNAFPPEFETALTALEPGEVSEPVRTEGGWHLIKLLDVRQQDAPRFEDQRAAIELELQKRAAEPLFVEHSEKLADMTYNSDGLQDAAKELGLELQHSPAFSRRGGEGLFADSRVIGAAFDAEVLTEGRNSNVIEIDPEHAVVVHLVEHLPERQLELAEVEERVRTLLAESIRREQARARADAILAKLRDGGGIEQLATAEKLEWQVALQYRRTGSTLPHELGEVVFETPASENGRSSVVLANGDVVVYEISNFKQGDPGAVPDDQRKQLREVLARARGAGAVAQYREHLRETADIKML